MTGIDDLSCYIPYYYLNIREFSAQKQLSFDKLNKGLGLEYMALANIGEDAATMASNAVATLIERNDLKGEDIGRLYVGTESSIDGSKPIASYVLGMLSERFASRGSFRRVDAVDLTFACIGGVDALLNTVDWVRLHPEKAGIVVCTDIAKYELDSPGEYTQGAGAVAILIRSNPRLLSIGPDVGVACKCEHDFFKPLRSVPTESLNDTAGVLDSHVNKRNHKMAVHLQTPVFDGHFSNECYGERMMEAFDHFKEQSGGSPLDRWSRMVFHLPYAFHGKRIFTDLYSREMGLTPEEGQDQRSFLKEVAATPAYGEFVNTYIEKGQRASSLTGNLYTASIFLSLMSLLESDRESGEDLSGKVLGFCAYGSGSKSKVFEGVVQSNWAEVVDRWALFSYLRRRRPLSFSEYEAIHLHLPGAGLPELESKFILKEVHTNPLYGQRSYTWEEAGEA